MVDHLAFLAAVEEYADALLHDYDIGEVLYRLTDQVVSVVGADGAGVALRDDDGPLQSVAATDQVVATLHVHDQEHAAGPSQQAWESGRQVLSPDLRDESRWPDWTTLALDLGCRAIATLPMPVGKRRIGVLLMWRGARHAWKDLELQMAQVLANIASGYVLNDATLTESRTLASQLQRALDSRVVIEQAKGVLAGQLAISPEAAFTLLRNRARDTRKPVHAISQGVVDGMLRLSSDQAGLPDSQET